MLRYLLLGLLRDAEAEHGYGLMKQYRSASGVTLSIGNVYRELQRLATLGLVRAVARPADVDPRRLPYAITDAGVRELAAWLGTPAGPTTAEANDHLALRAFVMAASPPDAGRLRVLQHWRDDLAADSRSMERHRHVARSGSTAGVPEPWALDLLLARRMERLAVDLQFIDRFIVQYRERSEAASARHGEVTKSGAARRPKAASPRTRRRLAVDDGATG